MSLKACIDEPVNKSLTYRHSVTVRGFAFCTEPDQTVKEITVVAEGQTVGSTTAFFPRPDIRGIFGQARFLHSGYEVLCALHPEPNERTIDIEVVATLSTKEERRIGRVALRLSETDYRKVDYGQLIEGTSGEPWTRVNIYGSGPPSSIPSLECLALLKRYLRPRDRVLDVGCGIGAYADALVAHGVDWSGCEVSPYQVDAVVARGLKCRRVEGATLPFEVGSFDRSICIEVLEHIAQPKPFVAEIARVTLDAAYFSVPNAELIPLMRPLNAVPWHLLELDHRNFFSRLSLAQMLSETFAHVELLQYAPLPIRSTEGLPLNCHLFAIASQPRIQSAQERIA